ncbi:MAG TPA: SDR family oxidoreductase [Mycolicibacillus parakoreensis]|nr:SDR family oxidoreductase [Mycolicibacillus parakoreensis]
MQLGLDDRTYLVTGGGSGIGRGVAAALVDSGAAVLLVGRDEARLAAAATEIGGGPDRVRYRSTDITDEQQVAAAVAELIGWRGRLHGVAHCAGGSQTIGPVTQIDAAAWAGTVELNLTGTMYVLKHSAAELVRGGGGALVAISSIAASNTHRWFGAYGPTKAGVDHLVMLAADELGASRVRVNGIRPGLIRTELVTAVLDSPELSADYRVNTPLPRPGEVTDVANLTLFLLSDAAEWITGQIINVDGGQSLRRGPDFTAMLEPAFGADGLRGVL